jgi:hypothetical protein
MIAKFQPKSSLGMYVWTTDQILSDDVEQARFLNEIRACGCTQVYLYMKPRWWESFRVPLENLISALWNGNIIAYAMDGYRGYFSDAYGPSQLYSGINNMLAYNSSIFHRFVGFMLDLEPQDGQGDGLPLFHNEIAETKLTKAQKADRNKLIVDWLTIHNIVWSMMQSANLRLGASLPSWTDSYYGEPMTARWQGLTQDITRFFMAMTDDYCVMSYNTNPTNAANRIIPKLQYAATLGHAPRVFGGVETHLGVGSGVSYADTPPKNSKQAVLTDLNVVYSALDQYPTFAGMNIHDWVGWRMLPLAGSNTAVPLMPSLSGSRK